MMELAVIENLQREDLNAIEEAESYQRLMTDLKITQQEVAKRLSKSPVYSEYVEVITFAEKDC